MTVLLDRAAARTGTVGHPQGATLAQLSQEVAC